MRLVIKDKILEQQAHLSLCALCGVSFCEFVCSFGFWLVLVFVWGFFLGGVWVLLTVKYILIRDTAEWRVKNKIILFL